MSSITNADTGLAEQSVRVETAKDPNGEPRILKGQVLALFAFDVGYEVSLEKLSGLFPSVPAQRLSPKKRTPTFMQYARPPHIVNLGKCGSVFGESGQIQATVFDFGVVSIAYRWPLRVSEDGTALEELPAISQRVYSLDLAAEARQHVKDMMKRGEPAITRPDLSSMVEDYYLFIIENLAAPLGGDEMLMRYRQVLAQTLRFEITPLSTDQQEDALRQKLSYYETDLLLVDWNAAILYDKDYEDTASVLELLNVELLEARYIDIELDGRIRECAQLASHRTAWPLPLRTPLRQAIRDLTELRFESSLLAERVGNSLKLIGDLYLARVYSAAAERFYLREWENIISHKLDIIDGFYQLVTDRMRTAQSQALEITVIVLILVEVLMGVFRH